MSFRCAKCDRPLYNRRRVTCEFCGSLIPNRDRLNASQRAAIDRLKAIEHKQHREFMEQNSGINADLPITGML
jgi:DNA-directed RNA polymerase subunit RPC12/RpoP